MNALNQISSDLASLLRPDVRAQLPSTVKSGAVVKTPFQDTLEPLLKAAGAVPSTTLSDQGALGRDAFLQLLVQQMQYQDPLAPEDNTQMIAQLAQFSSLEQMQNLNEGFQTFAGNLDQLSFISAGTLVGRHVTGLDVNGAAVDGVVDSVRMSDSVVYLTVGEQHMSMSGVLALRAA
jgi:flagellar basal-body rod modification protein FlgD